jgi:hypothetical protein
MDTYPPQTPPAQSQPLAENAADVIHRLEQTRAWIAAMQARAPLVPDQLSTQDLPAFTAQVDSWWLERVDGTGSSSLEQAIATRIATTMRDDAMLRGLDGTLGHEDVEKITAVVRMQGHVAPPGTLLRDVLFSGEPYPGALILADTLANGPALLFMPDRGWERYESLESLHEELEDRTRHELLLRDTLPGLRVAEVDRMVREASFVDSQPAATDIFAGMARRIALMQRAQVSDAWDGLARGDTPASVADAVRAALDLHGKLDIEAMHMDRQRRLLAAHLSSRLAGVPAPVRDYWLRAASEVRTESVEGLRELEANGVADAIMPPDNMNDADAVLAYRDSLLRAFDSRQQGRVRRHVAARLMRARMALAVADARLDYYLANDPSGFLDDHNERGFRWMRAVLDAPAAAERQTIEGHDIVVHQFTYRGAVVGDLLAVGARNRGSAARVVLYTPDAPDGRSVREFEDAAAAAREFLYNPRFESWLLDRLPASHATTDIHGARHFSIPERSRRTSWIVGNSDGRTFTATAEAFGEREVRGNAFEATYASVVSRMVLDMSELAGSLREHQAARTRWFAGVINDALSPGPRIVREVFEGVGRGMRALWRVEDALRAGDYARAFVDATEAYVNLLDLAPVAHGVVRPMFYLRRSGHASTLGMAEPLARPPARLDTRYTAANANLLGVRPDVRGVHSVGNRRYIVSSGVPYEVRFDATNATWRLARQGAADSVYTGPAIRWAPDGWRLRTDVGLRGGRRTLELPSPGRRPTVRNVAEADLAGLTANQRGQFLRTLRQRLGGQAADDLHIDVLMADGRALPVGPTRWNAWNDALEAAHRAPRAAPPPRVAPPLIVRPPWRLVPPEQWPDSVWYYPPGFVGALDHPTVYLPVVRVRGSGISGLVASPLDPALRQARLGVAPPRWVHVHLERLRGTAGRGPAVHVFVDDTTADPRYLLRSAGEGGTFLVLRPGQFTVGQPAVP